MTALREVAASPRFWLAAIAATLTALVVLGVPSGILANPVFVRTVATRSTDVAVWLISSPLIGLIVATYLVRPHPVDHPDRARTQLGAGALVAYFAIACPVCNKIVLLALGVSGALNVFAPLQPIIGVASVALLSGTLAWRMRQIGRGCSRCATAALPAE